jgi:hypothetical protein
MLALLILAPGTVHSQSLPRLRIDTNIYPYQSQVDNDTDLSFITNARLPGRFSYFSFMNFRGLTTGDSFEFVRSEQTLRWSISDQLPLDLSFQAVLVDGRGNDFSQMGVSWRVHDSSGLSDFLDRINLIYRVTFQLKRFGSADDSSWQIEQYFKLRFPGISKRLYLSGFIDKSFNLDVGGAVPANPVVLEVQGGVRFWKDFYAVVEYRKNEFRVGNESNLAVGFEYKFAWQ